MKPGRNVLAADFGRWLRRALWLLNLAAKQGRRNPECADYFK